MALILQLETATISCSVALVKDGETVVVREQSERNIHASHLTLFIEDVMNQAGYNFSNLDAIAVSMGPGSYTGLRIGVSTAKGLCFATDKPLLAINTLHAMAASMQRYVEADELLCPMIDARRMEVYAAIYDNNLKDIESTKAIILDAYSYEEYFAEHSILFFGDGSEKCKALFQNQPKAKFMAFENSATNFNQLALDRFNQKQFENVAYFEPFYLKDFLPGNALS